MVFHVGVLFHLGVCVKEILYLLTCFYFVLRVYLLLLNSLYNVEVWRELLGGPCINSHLFFADDNLIFCKASLEECDSLQRILRVYEKTLG